ncbi:MAG: peptide chain release factor N(5)-glutamine methyltransferase [Deltaproteobacteria bacterium]|nr:peptide chain release factor N(5)-glutamine methyltransferase [Deltaproteobacteria bacterium]
MHIVNFEAKSEPWTIGRVLAWTTNYFAQHGIESPRLDAEVLLAAVLFKNRLYLYTHYDQPLNENERAKYRQFVQRRAAREPVSYILGEREFYGLSFIITPDVLTPRPETEHLIDSVRDWLDKNMLSTPIIADVGTGSGIIAIALAKHFHESKIFAVDISEKALEVARQNAARHGVLAQLQLLKSDLLTVIDKELIFNIIAANLPYIADSERNNIMPEVRDYEPALALFAEDEGLALIKRLIVQAVGHLAKPGLLALEIGAGQWSTVQQILQATGEFDVVQAVNDLQGYQRIALAIRL